MRELYLEEGIKEGQSLIKEKLSTLNRSMIVLVYGGSCSGKTSKVTAELLKIFNEKASVFSMDDYYQGKNYFKRQAKRGIILNWDQPEAINLSLLNSHLNLLKSGNSVIKPRYNFKTSEREGVEIFRPNEIIIVDGIFEIEADIKIFVDAYTHERILRRILRDIERTGDEPRKILKYFSETVEPMHIKYVLPAKKNADLIIKNKFDSKTETENWCRFFCKFNFKS